MLGYLHDIDFLVAGSLLSTLAATFTVIFSLAQLRQNRLNSTISKMSLEREHYEQQVNRLTDRIYKNDDKWQEMNHLLIDSIKAQSNRQNIISKTDELGPGPFFNSLGIELNAIDIENSQAFVLTPFSRNYRATFEKIATVCREVGLFAKRGDEELIQGSILPHIVRQIASSRIIIAIIDGRNANVFYELGIAQAIGKPVIIISKSFSDVPFDLRQQQLVLYEDDSELHDRLRDAMVRLFAKV